MQKYLKNKKGFTLIELLVVVAIVSLLSSIVLASLTTARNKGKDAAIKTLVKQFVILLELEKSEQSITGYSGLQPAAWKDTEDKCNGSNSDFSSTNYRSKAREICVNIIKLNEGKLGSGGVIGEGGVYFGNATSPANNFSIMAVLPGSNKYFCVGSSGRNSELAKSSIPNPSTWNKPGCYSDP